MNSKRAMVPLAILAIAAIVPLRAQTQNNGLQIGQPQNPLASASRNPVQGMTTPPIQGMTTPPILPLGGAIAAPKSNGLITQPLQGRGSNNYYVLPPGDTIFVPAGTMVIENIPGMEPGTFLSAPAAPAAPAVPESPSTPRGPRGGASIQRSDRTSNNDEQAATTQTGPKDVSRLALGTPRDKVIEKYGNPIAYIMGMNGETLYFNSGVVVFIKGGVVGTPGQ